MSRHLTLHDPATARRYYDAGLWRRELLFDLMAGHAAARPDAPALRDGGRRLTWGELAAAVEAWAQTLHASGLRPGERVSLWLSNRVEAVVVLLACARNGYACNPSLHRNYTVAEIAELVRRIRARAVIVEEGWGADADRVDAVAALGALPDVRRIVCLPSDREGSGGPPLAGPRRPLPAPASNPDAVCYLAFTSGTTGVPKCVMHSHNTLLANARDLVADWGHDRNSVLLSLSPLSHHIAWVGVAQWLLFGGELAVNDPPPGTGALDWVLTTGATYLMGVPTHAMDLQAEAKARGLARLGAVEVAYMAGAPIPRATAAAFLAQGIKPQNVYGMTENSSHQYTHPDDDAETVVATCGRGGPAYEVRIFDAEASDRELGPGQVGQIGGRGAALMLGYFDNQRATEDAFNAAGWFLSGDLGVLDERGCLTIVGRLKDVIIRGGHNIYPARIEDLAVKHRSVAKAAAFPVADERLGEKACLAVLPAAGGEPAGADILDHLFAAGLSKYDMPEYFVVMEAFPLTASGKILKRELVEWAKSGRLRPEPVRFVEPAKRAGRER